LKILSEDGTLVWQMSKLRLVLGSQSTTFAPGEEKSFSFQWEMTLYCPGSTHRLRLTGYCPERTVIEAPPGVYTGIGLVEYIPDRDAHSLEHKMIESESVSFEIS
jgi:hypothetical protein